MNNEIEQVSDAKEIINYIFQDVLERVKISHQTTFKTEEKREFVFDNKISNQDKFDESVSIAKEEKKISSLINPHDEINLISSNSNNTNNHFPKDEELKKLVTNYINDILNQKNQNELSPWNTLYDPTGGLEINNKIQTNVIYRDIQYQNLFQVDHHSEELIEKKLTAEFKRNLDENTYDMKENNTIEDGKNSGKDVYNGKFQNKNSNEIKERLDEAVSKYSLSFNNNNAGEEFNTLKKSFSRESSSEKSKSFSSKTSSKSHSKSSSSSYESLVNKPRSKHSSIKEKKEKQTDHELKRIETYESKPNEQKQTDNFIKNNLQSLKSDEFKSDENKKSPYIKDNQILEERKGCVANMTRKGSIFSIISSKENHLHQEIIRTDNRNADPSKNGAHIKEEEMSDPLIETKQPKIILDKNDFVIKKIKIVEKNPKISSNDKKKEDKEEKNLITYNQNDFFKKKLIIDKKPNKVQGINTIQINQKEKEKLSILRINDLKKNLNINKKPTELKNLTINYTVNQEFKERKSQEKMSVTYGVITNKNISEDEFNKKKILLKIRNKTAKDKKEISKEKYIHPNPNEQKGKRGSSTKPSNSRQLQENYRKYLTIMNDPHNPYSTHWANKILLKQYKVGITVGRFYNGVPIIKLIKQENNYSILPSLNSKKHNDNIEGLNVRESQEIEFNTNRKNFYKARADIMEDPYENEMRESMEGNGEIQFPLIYNYLKN